MSVLVSRCLLGERCRYDGSARPSRSVSVLTARVHAGGGVVVPVCPELDGGLSCPRPPAERRSGRVVTAGGLDVTEAYLRGAAHALSCAQAANARLAVLKARSPSCGCHIIYDGTFSGVLVPGSGVLAELLVSHGVVVVDESALARLLPREASESIMAETAGSRAPEERLPEVLGHQGGA